MNGSTWAGALGSQRAFGSLLASFTTAKSILNPQAVKVTEPAFWYPGKMLHLLAAGALSNIATTPGTINFQVKVGPQGGTLITALDSGAIQLNATAHTTKPFWIEALLTCDSDGSGTNAKLRGVFKLNGTMFTKTAGQVDGVNGEVTIVAPTGTPVSGTGFDSTIQNVLDLWAGFSISDPGNGVRIDQFLPIAHDIIG